VARHFNTTWRESLIGRRDFLRRTSSTLLALGDLARTSAEEPGTRAFYDPTTRRHEPSRDHPESPRRIDVVVESVRALERQGRLAIVAPRPATEEQILLVHSPQYVNLVRTETSLGSRALSTGDTDISPDSFSAALAAAGTVVSAVDAVVGGRARTAFCAVRPPGHHASASRGMGFCIFNNVAVGARHALRRYGLDRILIADWDVHHGNGTQASFWRDGSVLFFDTHQHPWYPGTGLQEESGEGKGRGLIVNRPLPAGSGRKEILGAFREVLVPAAERFKPQLVMISAGFDSREGDPLGRFTLTDSDFAELTDILMNVARQHAGGRLISVLEGGYSLDGLRTAVDAHLRRLSG
jgi:acetoin utilization deacetylase AcuC-like enzyme